MFVGCATITRGKGVYYDGTSGLLCRCYYLPPSTPPWRFVSRESTHTGRVLHSHALSHTRRTQMQLHPRAGYWPGYYWRRSSFSPHSPSVSAPPAASTSCPFQACAMRATQPPLATALPLTRRGSISTRHGPTPAALPLPTYRPSCTPKRLLLLVSSRSRSPDFRASPSPPLLPLLHARGKSNEGGREGEGSRNLLWGRKSTNRVGKANSGFRFLESIFHRHRRKIFYQSSTLRE